MRFHPALIFLLLLPALLQAQTPDPAFCREFLQKAQAALDAKDWNRARDYCETALPLCPNTVDQLNLLLKKAGEGVEGEKKTAVEARKDAEENAKLAKKREQEARDALAQVEKEKAATELQRQKAEENFKLAEEKTKEAETQRNEAQAALAQAQAANERVLESVLQYADAAIRNMDYELALTEAHNAAGLQVKQAEVLHPYMEIAFWFNETGNTQRAAGILDTALTMLGKPKLSGSPGRQPARGQLREAMEKSDSNHYRFLRRRYYPHMVFIEGGTFQMGCDSVSVIQAFGEVNECPEVERQHTVTLGDYYLAETETTWWQFGLYRAANGKNVWEERASWLPTGDHPVVNVSWYDAIEYANWVSKQFPELEKDTVYSGDLRSNKVVADWTKKGFRLPTEAEWEYAASTGTKSVFAGTSFLDSLHFYGNYDDGSGSLDGFPYTSPAKKYLHNRRGLYDLSGNVWEWCWDWYDESYYEDGQVNPKGPPSGGNRVLRGGSWDYGADDCRSASRGRSFPDFRSSYYGFRLASLP